MRITRAALAAGLVATALGGAGPVSAGAIGGIQVAAAILPIDAPPVPLPDAYAATHDEKLRIDAPGVLANDIDADGDDLEARLVKGPAHGQVNLNHDGGFDYEPDPGFVGIDGFTYEADDGTIGVTAAVVLTVTNVAPVARDDSFQGRAGEKLSVDKPGVLKNDTDADHDTLLAKLVSGPDHGSLSFDDRGDFDYQPDAGFVGTDTFRYRATDGADASTPATVTIKVLAKAQPTPPPTPTAPPSPTPTPVVTPPPTPTPTPIDTPQPTPSPTPAEAAAPTETPTPSPTHAPTAPPGATPSPSPDPRATDHTPGSSGSQGSGSGPRNGGGGGPDGPEPAAAAGAIAPSMAGGAPFVIGPPGGAGASNASIAFGPGMAAAFDGFSWQVPALALSVPGLLVVVAVGLQVLGGLAWLPVIRRRVGGFGLRPRLTRRGGRT